MAIVSNKKYCLYKTELAESRYKHDSRKTVEGRDFGVGVWEELFAIDPVRDRFVRQRRKPRDPVTPRNRPVRTGAKQCLPDVPGGP